MDERGYPTLVLLSCSQKGEEFFVIALFLLIPQSKKALKVYQVRGFYLALNLLPNGYEALSFV